MGRGRWGGMWGGAQHGLCLQRTAGLIQSREAVHGALTGKKKVGESSGKGDPDGKTTGGKKQQRRTRRKTTFFFLFCVRAAKDTEERRRGMGAGKISEGRVDG